MAAASGVLLDQRGLAKVGSFSGKREDFESWIFQFESYLGLLGRDARVEAARVHIGQIDRLILGTDAEKTGRQLNHLLVTMTKGQALAIVKLTERGHGWEALRALYAEYRAGLGEDNATMLTTILTPAWWKDREDHLFTEVLTQWDILIAQYETASGERVTNNMNTSTIMCHAPRA